MSTHVRSSIHISRLFDFRQHPNITCYGSSMALLRVFLVLPTLPNVSVLALFVWFDSLCPSQQFFSYVGTDLPGLILETVLSKDKCVLLKDSDADEALTSGSWVWSQSLYQWATVLPVLALYHSCPSIFYLKYFGRFMSKQYRSDQTALSFKGTSDRVFLL